MPHSLQNAMSTFFERLRSPPFIFRSVFCGLYALLFGIALLLWVVHRQEALAGVWAVFLALPWFLILLTVVSWISQSALDYLAVGAIVLFFSASLNLLLLYVLGYLLDSSMVDTRILKNREARRSVPITKFENPEGY